MTVSLISLRRSCGESIAKVEIRTGLVPRRVRTATFRGTRGSWWDQDGHAVQDKSLILSLSTLETSQEMNHAYCHQC